VRGKRKDITRRRQGKRALSSDGELGPREQSSIVQSGGNKQNIVCLQRRKKGETPKLATGSGVARAKTAKDRKKKHLAPTLNRGALEGE